MQINKRSRAELKAYFVKNAIPTENNFAELIDAPLNQKDDGVVKQPGTPLSVEAVGDDTSQKEVLALYSSFADNNAAWRVSLNPRANPDDPKSAREGFSVTDAAGRSRLFIDAASGRLGVGTTSPQTALHVRSKSPMTRLESSENNGWLELWTSEGSANYVALCNRPGGAATIHVAGGGDALRVERDGRVSVGKGTPARDLNVGSGGQLSLSNNIGVDTEAGVYWHSDRNYALARTPGNWKSPYQQIELRWPTGIVLRPGTGNNAGHPRSYVNITGGKGLRISEGTMSLGPGEPTGDVKLQIAASGSDLARTRFAQAGGGVLEFSCWKNGWNINARTDGKHLHINRDAGSKTNLYLGKNGRETVIRGDNGWLGVLGHPSTHLHVHGNAWCNHLRADAGVTIGEGDRGGHIEKDGAFYRHGGQAYITVDDNLYVRDVKGANHFHFNTNEGTLTATKLVTSGDLDAKGVIYTQSVRVSAREFKVGGDQGKFYPIVWRDQAWGEGAFILEILRPSVHMDGEWRGSLMARFRAHSTNWGHGSQYARAEIHQFKKNFIGWYTNVPQEDKLVVWLRGGHSYRWRSNNNGALLDHSAKRKVFGGGTFNVLDKANDALKGEHIWDHKHLG